jgi:small conductance mechanosensitive channel
MDNVLSTIADFATTYGIRVVGAILVLLAGWMVAGVARRAVRGALGRSKTDPILVGFLGSLTFYLILMLAVLAALGGFGVQTASFVAVLGAAGFAVGFALQGALSNFAAGIMLLVFRPFRIGDYVDAAGVAGTVREVGLFTTVMTTPDNIRVIVPNGKIFGDTIKNITAEETRRVDMVFGIAYDAQIEQAMLAINEVLSADTRILKEPLPQLAVSELADSSVNLIVRPWVRKEDYWGVKFDVTRRVKEAFDAQGIEIPFPQRVVHTVPAKA